MRGSGEDDPRGQMRFISSGFFAALGVPMIAGRDFNDSDRKDSEPVVIVSQSVAQRMFPNQDAINRHVYWTDPVMKFIDISTAPRRIVGVAADVDDEHLVPGPALTIYQPFEQQVFFGGRLFVHTHIGSVCAGLADHAHYPRPCRWTNRWNAPRPSKISAPKCSRRTA